MRKSNRLGKLVQHLKFLPTCRWEWTGFKRGCRWLGWGTGLILILGLLKLFSPVIAIAAPLPPLPLADVASEKISQFAQAYLQVIDLIERRESELQQAETETESQQIQAAIQTEAFHLIGENQLTISEYLQLLGLANRDPDFREQILAQIEEVEGS